MAEIDKALPNIKEQPEETAEDLAIERAKELFGDKHPEMHPRELEVFSTLTEVTGHINIQASHPEFTNLSFLRNLETIGGRDLTEYFSSLYIVKTSLESLNLRSLKRIRAGKVYILENRELCFAENITWKN